MQWIKNNWKPFAMLGGGLAAIAVLTLAILSQQKDRGFMVRECVEGENMRATLTWQRHDLPVPVVIESTAEEFKPAVIEAILFWNDGTGLELFEYGGVMAPLDAPRDPVIIVDRMNAKNHGKAHLRWIRGCKIKRVEVGLPALTARKYWPKVTRHELGHALGLDHDDQEPSVMHPGGRVVRWGLTEMTESDRALLVSSYGGT